MRLFMISLCISLPASSLRRSGSRAKRESEELARKAFLNDGRQQEVKPFPATAFPKHQNCSQSKPYTRTSRKGHLP